MPPALYHHSSPETRLPLLNGNKEIDLILWTHVWNVYFTSYTVASEGSNYIAIWKTPEAYIHIILPVKCMQYSLCFARISQVSKVWRVLCWVFSGVWYANRILLCEATVQHTDLSHGQISNGKACEIDNTCYKSLLALARYQRIQASLMIAPFRKGYFLKWHIETYQVPPKSPKQSCEIGWSSHRNPILERHIEIETYQNHSKSQHKIGLEL